MAQASGTMVKYPKRLVAQNGKRYPDGLHEEGNGFVAFARDVWHQLPS